MPKNCKNFPLKFTKFLPKKYVELPKKLNFPQNYCPESTFCRQLKVAVTCSRNNWNFNIFLMKVTNDLILCFH